MKQFYLGLALCGLALASCSKEETKNMAVNDPNAINFRANTTRASIAVIDDVMDSEDGFLVYAASGSAPTGWYSGIDGTNNYKYSYTDQAWKWQTSAPQWPSSISGYPMNFYAYFASSYTGLSISAAFPSSFRGTYTIQPEATQVDLLYAKATTINKPGDGSLPLVFGHVLTKINFGVIPGVGSTVYLQSINVNNVGNLRTFDFIDGNWTALQPEEFSSDYVYKATANPATSLLTIDPTEGSTVNITPTYTNLMLMPQTATTWTPVSDVAAANAYMGVIYRIQTAANPNSVGYAAANSHPDYTSLTSEKQTALNGKPLFVKVGYPFAENSVTWDKGKGYTYNICLGTAGASNGYIVDTHYYDEAGNPTSLTIVNRKVGEPISNGTINFNVDVTDWNNQTANVIQ